MLFNQEHETFLKYHLVRSQMYHLHLQNDQLYAPDTTYRKGA